MVNRCRVLCLVGVACGAVLLGIPLQSASAQPAVGDCAIHTKAETTGPGCCNFEPQSCDYYIYTYVAYCSGLCEVNKECVATQSVLAITYAYEDCSGSCPDDCETVESTITWSTVPTECGCRPLRQ